ncbi:MAG: PEP-CTERM sorting domain-containing protein [Verrucomicrobiota bacterium]
MSLCVLAVPAQSNYNFAFPVNLAVPAGDANGLALNENLTGINGIINSLTVSLDISSGYNGDLYAYLRGPNGGFAVLLNRVGATSGDAFGYSDTGFNVTFDDSAAGNIHHYQDFVYDLNGSGQLTGTWQPDGRAIDPQSSPSQFDSTSPTALLNSFSGTVPNGTWTLFLADLSSGAQSTVINWSVNIDTVPEPGTLSLFTLCGCLVAWLATLLRAATRSQRAFIA